VSAVAADTRIDACFARRRQAGQAALIPFITCGDPSLEAVVPVMHALVEAGADLIELGIPFSEPQADGPVIQRASERALERHVGLGAVFDCVRRFRQRDLHTPVVLMGYLNPVEIHGSTRFATAAAEAGVDGVLLVDSPPEESHELSEALGKAGLQMILLAAPTTDPERLLMIAAASRGYLYYVSFAGVTGAAGLAPTDVQARVESLRANSAVPVAVGFGVKDAESAAAIGRFADGVVIGSALVETLAEATDPADAARRARDFLTPIRAALDRPR
jgi:tryptophan synthase alpha chain